MLKVSANIPEGKCTVGKPRKRWLADDENNMKEVGVRGWRKIARDRGAWRLILNETRVLRGLVSQCREETAGVL